MFANQVLGSDGCNSGKTLLKLTWTVFKCVVRPSQFCTGWTMYSGWTLRSGVVLSNKMQYLLGEFSQGQKLEASAFILLLFSSMEYAVFLHQRKALAVKVNEYLVLGVEPLKQIALSAALQIRSCSASAGEES